MGEVAAGSDGLEELRDRDLESKTQGGRRLNGQTGI
jgi:hypothetical protein